MIPSPSGSLVKVKSSVPLEALATTAMSQFATSSRGRAPSKRLIWLPRKICRPSIMNGFNSWSAIFRLLNNRTFFFKGSYLATVSSRLETLMRGPIVTSGPRLKQRAAP